MEIINYPDYLIYREGRVQNKKSKRFLKEGIHKDGYKMVGLRKDNKQKFFSIHRLVGIHYIPNLENKPTIDHINRDPSDNRVENLRWATRLEQQENTGMKKNNTSGHRGIYYRKDTKKWRYCKWGKYKVYKSFKCKIDCLCFKYIYLLKIKSNLLQTTNAS